MVGKSEQVKIDEFRKYFPHRHSIISVSEEYKDFTPTFLGGGTTGEGYIIERNLFNKW